MPSGMAETMRAAVTTGDAARPVEMSDVPIPVPAANQALVRVEATSLNAGEVRRAVNSPAGQRVGWDIAGTIELAAADGTGPPQGARVTTFADATGWAEFVAVDARQLGVVPAGVTFDDAAALPVAGVTALRALARRGNLIGRRALVVPGTGGVGLFAVQLGGLMGARVSAVIRDAGDVALLESIGAHDVIVGTTNDAQTHGPFDVILESLGGDSRGAAMACVASDGVVVSFGQTIAPQATFTSAKFYATGGASLYGFYLFHEARHEPVGADLERLAALVERGALRTHVEATYSAERFNEAVAALRERRVTGKIIVRFR
jgi:NADPH2:quinone reductase